MFSTYSISDFLEVPPKLPHFHLNRLEEMPPLPEQIKSPHKHEFYEVFLVKKGQIWHQVDYQEFELRENSFFFITQGQLHFWSKTDRAQLTGYRLMFTEDFFQINQPDNQFLFELIYLDNIYQTPLLKIALATAPIFSYFDLMYQEFERQDCNEQAIRSLLFLALTEIQRLMNASKTNLLDKHQLQIYKQFVPLLEANFTQKWSVENYAEQLYITPKNLNRALQQIVNQNFTTLLQNRITLEAKRLLSFSSLTVNQIGSQLGFEDSSYFSRFFKKNTSLSPIEFRQKSV